MLPAPLTSFVGRADELAAVAAHRLVTLSGPGGCGKSRLAVGTARRSQQPLLGFVEMSPAGPDASLPLVALAGCAVRDDPGTSPRDRLLEHLHDRAGLLVLDNCEHVRAGVAALLDDLLPGCPDLHVLVTSRVVLGLVGETTVPLGGLASADAAALFVDRARLVAPGLDEPENVVVAEICRLADGLPLAVELAAARARARALSIPAIRDGMADRLRFLAARDGRPGAPHRSLVASLDRSAELVGDPARRALAALSVLDGRFPLDVALRVTADDREAIESLVEHSLVQFDAADRRYLLLDTVRDYAGAALDASGGAREAHDRLLDWAVDFAEETRAGLERADPQALRRADECDAAVSSALQRAVTACRGTDGALVAADLAFAWSLRGRCAEGLEHVERLVAALDPVPSPLRWAHAFLAAYSGALESGFALATVAAEEAAALQMLAYTRRLRAQLPAALAAADAAAPTMDRLGHSQLRAWDAAIRTEAATGQGRFAQAQAWGQEGLRLAVAVGEPVSALGSLLPLLRALVATGRTDEAEAVLDGHREFFRTHPGMAAAESIALATAVVAVEADPETATRTAEDALAQVAAIDQAWLAAEAADLLGLGRLRLGDVAGAREAVREAVCWAERLGHRGLVCRALLTGAAAERMRGGDALVAHDALAEAARLGLRPLAVDGLEIVAALAADEGRDAVALRLTGAARRLQAELGAVVSPLVRQLGVTAGPAADQDALGWEAAVAYATRSRGRRGRPRAGWDSLTPTEREVVALTTRGLTNAAIGNQLLISPGTVRTHLRSVFAKLGVSSRAELAARAVRQGM